MQLTRLETAIATIVTPDTDEPDDFWYEDGPQPIRDYWDAIAVEWRAHPLFSEDPSDTRARDAVFAAHPVSEDICFHVWHVRQFPDGRLDFEKLLDFLLWQACQRVAKHLMEQSPVDRGDSGRWVRLWGECEVESIRLVCGVDLASDGNSHIHYWMNGYHENGAPTWIYPARLPFITAWRATGTDDLDLLRIAGLHDAERRLLAAEEEI